MPRMVVSRSHHFQKRRMKCPKYEYLFSPMKLGTHRPEETESCVQPMETRWRTP